MGTQNFQITITGDVQDGDTLIGRVQGLQFTPLTSTADSPFVISDALQEVLSQEYDRRITRISEAVDDAFILSHEGIIRWLGEPVGRLIPGPTPRQPDVSLLADASLDSNRAEPALKRLQIWLARHIDSALSPLALLQAATIEDANVRTLVHKIVDNFGIVERGRLASIVRALTPEARGQLRSLGIRIGVHHLYLPLLLKPAPRILSTQLWALSQPAGLSISGLEEVLPIVAGGRTSIVLNTELPQELYKMAGLRPCGERAIRVDIIERLLDIIRPAQAFRLGESQGNVPAGAAREDYFTITPEMLSLIGCTLAQLGTILTSLNYVSKEPPVEESSVEIEAESEVTPEELPIEAETAQTVEVNETTEPETAAPETESDVETETTPRPKKEKEVDLQKQAMLALLWRYEHPPRPPRTQHHPEKKPPPNKGKRERGPNRTASKSQRPAHKPAKREAPPNMDSPFANLLSLKEELQNDSSK